MHRALKTQRVSADYLQRGLERFRATLLARNLKLTKGRTIVARFILQCAADFNVGELARSLRSQGMREAHAVTVYRAMPLLVEAGIVRMIVAAAGDAQRYEVVFERAAHPHLCCSKCGHISEFQASSLDALQRELAQRFGFALDAASSQLPGRCKSCQRVEREKPARRAHV
jgi:Fe2+ or Zn2+ uptake regulation protein